MELEVLLDLGMRVADPAVDEIGGGGDGAQLRDLAGVRIWISLNITPPPAPAESPARRQDSGFRARLASSARRGSRRAWRRRASARISRRSAGLYS